MMDAKDSKKTKKVILLLIMKAIFNIYYYSIGKSSKF